MSTNQQVATSIEGLRLELLNAESILNTQYSFDLAEPSYIKCLQQIADMPEQHEQIVKLIIRMFTNGDVSDEPVAFLMHALRWAEIYDWAQGQLASMESPIVNGRPFVKIIAAFKEDWENKEFYKMFIDQGSDSH